MTNRVMYAERKSLLSNTLEDLSPEGPAASDLRGLGSALAGFGPVLDGSL